MSEYVSLKDKIRENMQEKTCEANGIKHVPMKSYKVANLDDIDEIKKALAYILEKLTDLDYFVRGRQYRQNRKQGKYDNEDPCKSLPSKDLE